MLILFRFNYFCIQILEYFQFMSIIFILVIIGAIVAGGFLLAFVWAVKSGQYEDSYSPSVRILFDDHINKPENNQSSTDTSIHKKDPKNKDKD